MEPDRREAYQRLLEAARRAGVSLDRLHHALRQVASNEAETRRFLAEEVYRVPESLLDDALQMRLRDLADPEAE